MKKFNTNKLKQSIVERWGSIKELKNFLKYEAEDIGFDVRLTEVEVDGVKIKHSGNPNHFAEFYVEIRHVGMVGTYGLDYDSITTAGKRRGSGNGRLIF